jgi:hypothetical protein
MEEVVVAVEQTQESVQDKQAIIELPREVLDRVGGGTILILL